MTHLSETVLQALALNETQPDELLSRHLQSCASCRDKIDTYRTLFSALHDKEKFKFHFDLAALVLPQVIPEQPTLRGWKLSWLLVLAGIFLTLPCAWIAIPYLRFLFFSVSAMTLLLVGAGFLMLTGLVVAELYQQYRERIQALHLINLQP